MGGTWHLKRRSRSRYQGTAGQNSVMTVHRRAIAAWQSLPAEQQDLWESYSLGVEPHSPPFDHTTRISGYNLFVSAYHGFATLGNEHVPTPRAFDSFPPFAVDLVGATNVGGELRIQLQATPRLPSPKLPPNRSTRYTPASCCSIPRPATGPSTCSSRS